MLNDRTPAFFDPYHALCHILLAEIKESHPGRAKPVTVPQLSEEIFSYVQQFKKCSPQDPLYTVLERLDRTIAGYEIPKAANVLKGWNFITFAVMSNLTHCIAYRFETNRISD